MINLKSENDIGIRVKHIKRWYVICSKKCERNLKL